MLQTARSVSSHICWWNYLWIHSRMNILIRTTPASGCQAKWKRDGESEELRVSKYKHSNLPYLWVNEIKFIYSFILSLVFDSRKMYYTLTVCSDPEEPVITQDISQWDLGDGKNTKGTDKQASRLICVKLYKL